MLNQSINVNNEYQDEYKINDRNAGKINERNEYKLLSLTYKVLTTSHCQVLT